MGLKTLGISIVIYDLYKISSVLEQQLRIKSNYCSCSLGSAPSTYMKLHNPPITLVLATPALSGNLQGQQACIQAKRSCTKNEANKSKKIVYPKLSFMFIDKGLNSSLNLLIH